MKVDALLLPTGKLPDNEVLRVISFFKNSTLYNADVGELSMEDRSGLVIVTSKPVHPFVRDKFGLEPLD
jgi:hypothetical protein